MAETRAGVGIVGCGNISGIYVKNGQASTVVDIVACTDLDLGRAQARAEEYGIPTVHATVADLLADPAVDIVLNLTIPGSHAAISHAALEGGKHVYSEKPLALNRNDGQRLLDTAQTRGLLIGCAPDTFLGGGLQTCRALIDEGVIGEPVAASAFMMSHGPEGWHPDPAFFFQPGAGPMFDMGPYYLTALVSLLGPMRRVTGSARISFPERTITSQPKNGTVLTVTTPTHITGTIDFASGAVATITTSFDVWSAELPRIEIYGSKGTLSVPDPNTFGGPIRLRLAGATEWQEVEPRFGHTENSRGLGLEDLARAAREGGTPRASGAMAYHVLDAMQAFLDASHEGRHITLSSTCVRPAPLAQ